MNSNPDQSPSRWVINFHDWAFDAEHDNPKKPKGAPYAADYPDCLAIVEEKVKPEREANKYSKSAREKWWLYERNRPELYDAIAECDRVLVTARVSPSCAVTWISSEIVFNEKLVIFPNNSDYLLTILQNSLHWEWARQYTSTLGATTLNYAPSDCFETFPFPTSTPNLEEIGEKYYTHRQTIMQTRQEGLTKTYNRFHNPDETDSDIEHLRQLHIEMDYAVAAAYGWTDLLPSQRAGGLEHDFHETKQGLRFTISETVRREVLDRLLQLNHERYAEEVAAGLHDKKKKGKSRKKKGKKKASPGQTSLF
ncbi:hypothetical protein [Coleofasciculus chthonoplastes]|uniref:hypothetical protein n=1 Tax=Coleofasciculus chthonoplastes TaxID=64178 RepID=UPI0032F38F99